MDWDNHLEKNPIQKIERTVKIRVKLPHVNKKPLPRKRKIRVKLPHVNKKPLPRKRIFLQIPFSHSTLKLEQKTSRRKTTRFLHFLFRRDKNHHSNLKIMKMCEHILKKSLPPIQFKFFDL